MTAPVSKESHAIIAKYHPFLTNVKKAIDDTLHPTAAPRAWSHSKSPKFKINYKPVAFFWGGSSTTTIINNGTMGIQGQQKKDDGKPEDSTRVLVGVASAVVGVVSMFALGAFLSKKNEVEEEKDDVKKVIDSLKRAKPVHPNNVHLDQITEVATEVKKIVKQKQQRNFYTLCITAAFVASAALGLLGALFASTPLMLCGVAAFVITAGALAFKFGYEWFDKTYEKKMQKLEPIVNGLFLAHAASAA